MFTKYIKQISVGLLLGAFFLISCKKENTKMEMPSVSKVTTIKNLDSSIVEGNMGDWIAIHGTSLADIKQMFFNDVEVNLEEIYEENNVVYVQIPVKLPLDITNKLYVTTSGGTTEFIFNVKSPDLELTTMFNEYTLPGDTIRIYGRFLKLYEVDATTAVVKFGDIEKPVISATETYITAQVPLNVQPNVKVKLISNKYNTEAVCSGFYQDKNNVITSFDTDFPYTHATGQARVGDWTSPAPTSGKYMRFEVDQTSHPTGLGWFYMMENSYNYKLDMIQHPENYVLKFEMNMGLPIRTTKFFIYYYWAVNPTGIGGEHFTVQNLNTWQTVTIPLEKIIPMGNTGTSTSFSLNFRVENYAPVERLAMYFDNFRIYKKGE